jgi:glycosyltransferase involved in cell wall biosynthesis
VAKRVLLTTFTYPPNQDGVAIATSNFAAGLIANGYDVTVATRVHPSRKGNEIPGTRVAEFAVDGSASTRFEFTGEVERYVEFVRTFSCDFIVCQAWDAWSTSLAQKAFRDNPAKKLLVSHGFTSHLLNFHPRPFFGLGVWLGTLPIALSAPWTMRCYDHVIFLSERRDFRRFFDHTLAHWTSYQSHSSIPNGVWLQEFESKDPFFRDRFKIETASVVLCVANYSDRKNQLKALEAFAECSSEDATLVFIGSVYNEYAAKLEAKLRELSAQGFKSPVKILHGLGRKDVYAAYHASTIFLLTAKAETQPIVLLEAMANRLPFVSTDSGCVRELIGGIVANSKKQLVAALQRLLDDEAERRRLGQAGRALVEREYHWPPIIDSYVRLLEKLNPNPTPKRAATQKR